MAVKLAPSARRQFTNASGVPYSGAKLFYYAAGSTTKQNTYTTSAGSVANTNPIILDSAGRTPYGVWLTEGLTYKEVLAPSNDTDPPTSPIFSEDNISGINDTNTTVSEWISSGLTPTYLNTTQFTVPGDNTSDLHVGRRLKFLVTAGTVYGRISVSAYTSLTTVTVVMDSGQVLDSGLTSFDMSILSRLNNAIPALADAQWDEIGVVTEAGTQTVSGVKTFSGANVHSGANTFSGNNTHSGTETHTEDIILSGSALLWDWVAVAAHATNSNIWVSNFTSLTGSAITFTDFADAPRIGAETEIYCNAAHTFTHSANIVIQGSKDYTAEAGDRVRVKATNLGTFFLELVKKEPFASQADMEAATDAHKSVTPSVMKNHPGVAKAYVVFDGTGATGAKSLMTSYGVSGVTKNGTGNYTVTFSAPFSSSNYAATGFAEDDGVNGAAKVSRHVGDTRAPSNFQARVRDDAGTAIDSAFISLTFFGDQ